MLCLLNEPILFSLESHFYINHITIVDWVSRGIIIPTNFPFITRIEKFPELYFVLWTLAQDYSGRYGKVQLPKYYAFHKKMNPYWNENEIVTTYLIRHIKQYTRYY